MHGCPEMESYEEFCLRSLALLHEEGKFKKKTCEPLCSLKTLSVIDFHGRAVLSPLLSTEQRTEMCGYRLKAVQLELDRHNRERTKLLTRVQGILDQTQVQVPSTEDDKLPVSKPATVSGYTLVTDSPGLPRNPGFGPQVKESVVSGSETPVLNGYRTEEEVTVEKQEKSEEEEEEDEDISLDSLLKRSREYVKREQSQQAVVHSITQTPPETTKEEKSCSTMRDMGVEFGFSLHHSPLGHPPIQYQASYEPNPQKSVSLSASKPERYACLPTLESSISPHQLRRKPRPVSTGNIHISFPIGPADLIPRSPGRSGEGAGMADWGEALSAGSSSTSLWVSEGRDAAIRSGNHQSSYCGTSPVQEHENLVSASLPSSMAHPDHMTAGFRRRCHTLDSQLNTYQSIMEHLDRSQERVPRFMAGVTWLGPSRRAPTSPLTQSYEVENHSTSLLRARLNPDSVTLRMETEDPRGPSNGRRTPTVLRGTVETIKTEEAQWRAQALEDKQRHLEEEHALQISLLLAEQEKEQQRLCLLEETERRLKEQGGGRGDSCGWNCRSVNGSCPVMSPSCPGLSPIHTPSERSPGHNMVFPSPVPSSVTSPSVQPPVYVWGSTWGANKPRARLSLVLTAEHQKAFCRIGAIIRGFLIRRLLRTEKVKHLRQTVVDTQEFIRSFQTEAAQKKSTYSAQDLSLQERVRAQLRAALYDIHDIFFEMPLEDRLVLLQQDRELRTERKLRDLEKAKSPKDRVSLSAATQRSLDRKKRVGDSPAQVRKMQHKPKSPTTNRVQKSNQGQNSPTPGQLNRQGSWYRKTPEERLKRSDSLKKQHSLG
ncbi:centriolar coiled-coil protein of 110 kDa-like [Melanotaenia boesemani]|uniref:centriolar coiled-coil protein of 110 kDa-like n=1 Tax=Melanotaenia boesemani TaxID=1250792 RepID=UPI001C04230D|nr:centriolar coiled-coil protein of 110 kDa-like [Melanotaenia boesemani]